MTIRLARSVQATSPLTRALLARSRAAVTRCETGLTRTNAASGSGMVSTGTNAFDRNVSGNRIIMEMPCTAWALRAMVPTQVKTHASDQPVKIASRIAASTPPTPPPGR
ncbi:hypothetical protein GCM10017600_08360 [Streptosporangium carneum]|uniref:Uncharacterized protein n=1 Tax=Streptosporangium carneum TaxID=47481 RepID=A0A9W6HX61_9ACTN|nr:hypothetical protein GCM10017600_08360 [Streptosporangium carneum]